MKIFYYFLLCVGLSFMLSSCDKPKYQENKGVITKVKAILTYNPVIHQYRYSYRLEVSTKDSLFTIHTLKKYNVGDSIPITKFSYK